MAAGEGLHYRADGETFDAGDAVFELSKAVGVDIANVGDIPKLIVSALLSPPAQAEAEVFAVLRFAKNTPGNENEMPKVISCNWLPDGDYQVFLAPAQAEASTLPEEVVVSRTRAALIEACAKIAETLPIGGGTLSSWINTNESPMGATRRHIATAIRAHATPPTTPAVESGEAVDLQAVLDIMEARARYFESGRRDDHYTRSDAARSYRATAKKIAKLPAVESESADRGVEVERVAKIICRAAGKEPDELVPGSYRPSGYPNFFEDGGVAGDMAHYQWREYTTAALAAINGETT
jgi:hypothetical protein